MSAYRETRQKMDEAFSPEVTGGRYLPCTLCRKETLTATLMQYGARCHSCYESYCRQPIPQAGIQKWKGAA